MLVHPDAAETERSDGHALGVARRFGGVRHPPEACPRLAEASRASNTSPVPSGTVS